MPGTVTPSGPQGEPGGPRPRGAGVDREALSALPSVTARIVAFVSVLVAGLAGGLIGYAFMQLQTESATWPAVGALVGAVVAAAGTAVVAVLVLRAMGEWRQMRDQ
jgi:hypothetical protein